VKELKVSGCNSTTFFPHLKWNPVKELKDVRDGTLFFTAVTPWNPVKELKEQSPPYHQHRLKSGIR